MVTDDYADNYYLLNLEHAQADALLRRRTWKRTVGREFVDPETMNISDVEEEIRNGLKDHPERRAAYEVILRMMGR